MTAHANDRDRGIDGKRRATGARLGRLLGRLVRVVGPTRAHRFGHGDAGDGGGDGTGGADAGSDAPAESDAAADVLAAVADRADEVHGRLAHDAAVPSVEFLGATGSGKTALVETLLDRREEAAGVVVGDVAGDDDARRYRERGARAVDVTTGKDCHLDPGRIDAALDDLPLADLDRVYVENVGNMVCPADFPLGADLRVVVVSVTEGEDVVRKHPLLFRACDVAVVNKVDVADAVGVDPEAMVADLREVAPDLPVVETSAETGAGVDDLTSVLEQQRREVVRAHGD